MPKNDDIVVVDQKPQPMPWDVLPSAAHSHTTGIEKPELVARMLVLDAMKQFQRMTGRAPKNLYIPRSLEALLQVDRGRNLGLHESKHGKLREAELLYGCRPVWDAIEFRVD